MNIEHPTPNIQRRMWFVRLLYSVFSGIQLRTKSQQFDVQRSMFDVGRSSFQISDRWLRWQPETCCEKKRGQVNEPALLVTILING